MELGMIWRAIPGLEQYEVSERGDVRRDGRTLKQQIHRGYKRVQVWIDGRPRSLRVHREVCEAFNGPAPTPEHEVEHMDHNKSNNTPANLCWTTHASNMRRSVRDRIHSHGEGSPRAKLTEAQVKIIKDTPRYYGCARDLAERFGVSKQTIGGIRSGFTWRHVA